MLHVTVGWLLSTVASAKPPTLNSSIFELLDCIQSRSSQDPLDDYRITSFRPSSFGERGHQETINDDHRMLPDALIRLEAVRTNTAFTAWNSCFFLFRD